MAWQPQQAARSQSASRLAVVLFVTGPLMPITCQSADQTPSLHNLININMPIPLVSAPSIIFFAFLPSSRRTFWIELPAAGLGCACKKSMPEDWFMGLFAMLFGDDGHLDFHAESRILPLPPHINVSLSLWEQQVGIRFPQFKDTLRVQIQISVSISSGNTCIETMRLSGIGEGHWGWGLKPEKKFSNGRNAIEHVVGTGGPDPNSRITT